MEKYDSGKNPKSTGKKENEVQYKLIRNISRKFKNNFLNFQNQVPIDKAEVIGRIEPMPESGANKRKERGPTL